MLQNNAPDMCASKYRRLVCGGIVLVLGVWPKKIKINSLRSLVCGGIVWVLGVWHPSFRRQPPRSVHYVVCVCVCVCDQTTPCAEKSVKKDQISSKRDLISNKRDLISSKRDLTWTIHRWAHTSNDGMRWKHVAISVLTYLAPMQVAAYKKSKKNPKKNPN